MFIYNNNARFQYKEYIVDISCANVATIRRPDGPVLCTFPPTFCGDVDLDAITNYSPPVSFELGPIQKQWLADLRSGKYEQGKGVLYNKGKYCCLGVAAIQTLHAPVTFEEDDALVDGQSLSLSWTLQEKLGLNGNEGQPLYNGERLQNLSYLNDDLKWSFDQIADHLEKYGQYYFKESK